MPIRRRFGVRATAPDAMRRNLALLRAFRDLERRRVTIGAIAGVVVEAEIGAAVIAARPGPVTVVLAVAAAAVLFAAITFGVAAILRPRRVSRALDLYRWVDRADRARWRSATGEDRPSMPRAARAWLESHPASGGSADLPRIELLMWIGEFEAASRVVGALPTATAEERFERALRRAAVDFVASGDGELTAARVALAELPDEARPEATARLAVEEARQMAATARPGDGPTFLEPLVRARDVPGLSIEGHLLPDLARWVARPLLMLGTASAVASFVVAVLVVRR
ncbi:MAG: hypothetical protein ACHQ3P_10490 [Candidatus Limnocylindrales bacterium]